MSKSANSRPIDALTGIEVDDDFEQFDQKFEVYCRTLWDDKIINKKSDEFFKGYYMPFARARKTEGFSQKDYALRNASWHVTNVIRDIEKSGEFRKEKPDEIRKEGFWDYFTSHDEGWHEPFDFESEEEATKDIRRVASLFGVGALRVCAYDDRWTYGSI
ncbi:MAG: reductive dehalogenase, partial [Kordiimonas sp.]